MIISDGPRPEVKGWCPGALRPMESGDGLIVRVKIPLGIVTIALALRIAEWSQCCGNGIIDLSSRANLQLRGVSRKSLIALQSALSDAGLLDADARSEAVRNVILSPLSDLDPDAVMNVQPVARNLDRMLRTETRLHDLPAKFGFAIDDAGSFATGPADVTFEASRTRGGPAFFIRLANERTMRFGPCMPHRLTSVAHSLGSAFLEIASRQDGTVRRMRDLVACTGAAAIAKAAGLGAWSSADIPAPRPRPVNPLGPHAIGTAAFVGVGLPFGRVNATDLADLVKSAAEYGAQDIRLTPYRAVFIPMPSADAARQLAKQYESGPFILHPADPRRRVAACPGAPGCSHASTSVRDDAVIVASAITGIAGSAILVHVSGCEKGCAHPATSPITLIGRHGSYDLVRNGTASGSPVLKGLTPAQVVEAVTAELQSVVG